MSFPSKEELLLLYEINILLQKGVIKNQNMERQNSNLQYSSC